tara:strand:+ start:1092 stop:2090 length:999 start_codon:yes stop_codon:yes gene_type:complete
MTINSAVIGTGIGEKHIEAIDNYKDFKVKIICEINKKKIPFLKKKYKDKIILSDENEIFRDKSIKLISIASYDEDHFRQIKKCIKYKKYFVVEKPICLTLNQLNKIGDLIKKNKIKLFSNLVLRVNSLFKNIKKKIKKKEVFYIEADYLWGRRHKLLGWRSKTSNYSLTLGAGIHMIDLIMWFLNSKPISVTAHGNKKITKNTLFNKHSLIIYIFEFPNDITVKISANAAGIYEHFHQLKIFEKNKTIDHSFNSKTNMFYRTEKKIKKKIIEGNYPDKINRKKLIRNYLDYILNKKTKLILNNREQLDLMTTCLYADRALKLKKKIKIKYLK